MAVIVFGHQSASLSRDEHRRPQLKAVCSRCVSVYCGNLPELCKISIAESDYQPVHADLESTQGGALRQEGIYPVNLFFFSLDGECMTFNSKYFQSAGNMHAFIPLILYICSYVTEANDTLHPCFDVCIHACPITAVTVCMSGENGAHSVV